MKKVSEMYLQQILLELANRIKSEFYYEFDELIPSIMSDKIDKIVEEILAREGENI